MPQVNQVKCVFGEEAASHAADLARLRIAVFREYPYLYDGDMAYEKYYIQQYVQSPGSVIVLAMDGDTIVGASTALPLADETQAFKQPFIEQGIAPAKVFYFGESVLLPAYRGQGIGHRFFDQREAHAWPAQRSDRRQGTRWWAWCSELISARWRAQCSECSECSTVLVGHVD